jgi:hypothetical protein
MKNQSLRAVGRLALLVGIATVSIATVRLALANINPSALPYIAMGCFVSFMLYIGYTIILSQIQYEDKIKEMKSKFDQK